MKTPEQLALAEYFRSLRHEKNPDIRFQMMKKHAKGQCEKILDNGERCPNRHGEAGVTIRGTIILTPKPGPKPILECQKCGFQEIAAQLDKPVHARKTRVKVNPDQTTLV